MKINTVFLSKTANDHLYNLSINAIESLKGSIGWSIDNEIILVESMDEVYLEDRKYHYNEVKKIHPKEKFNYNKYLNFGISEFETTPDWVLVCNNDIIFDKRWLIEMQRVINHDSDICSLSPLYPQWHTHINKINGDYELGYKVSEHVCGWCIMFKYELIDKLNLFDERFEFYYQDDDYSLTLQKNNLKHALVYKSHVEHKAYQSKDVMHTPMMELYQTQYKILTEKWNL